MLSSDGRVIAIPGDISNMEGIKALADTIAAKEARVDILVNNAGCVWEGKLALFICISPSYYPS